MTETISQLLLTIIIAVLGSTGIWSWLESRREKKDGNTQILLGLGHDRICYLGKNYIKRGYITKEEYENLFDYLWKPYHARGGNGSAERIIKEVDKLPIRDHLDMVEPKPDLPSRRRRRIL